MKKYLGKEVYNVEMETLRKNHKNWKEQQRTSKASFFIVYTDFKSKLKDVSGGALKLYVFIGFHANNLTGECWVSAETVAEFFENDERTVKKWFSELIELGLIERIQTGFHRIANTFFLPYSNSQDEEVKKNEEINQDD